MNNGTINNAQMTCKTGGTVLQATHLNAAQETLQQLLASELTKPRSSIIEAKQGDMEQRAIELAQAVGSAFTALDCLPGQLSNLQSRAIRTEELSLKLLLAVTALLDRITGTSLGSDFADTRPVPSDQIGRTSTAVRRTEEYLNSAVSWFGEIDKALNEHVMVRGADTQADGTVMGAVEFHKMVGIDGGITREDVAQLDMNAAILNRTSGSARYPVTWVIRMGNDDVQFARVVNGSIDEDYAPVDNKKAGVYAAAILNGLEPPRHLQPSDKQTD
ncbi:hypothetical protein [Yersinia enterocolitica]|uniref:hypothetical protein n=1 Tax=Yersinia enterocolitica TaxID=630 RepID=UPI003D08B919